MVNKRKSKLDSPFILPILKMISKITVNVNINLRQIKFHAIRLIKTSQNLTIKQQYISD